MATPLQGRYDQLMGLANADDGNGNFLFAGVQSGTVPFAPSASGATVYQGDMGRESGNNGAEVFMNVSSNAGYVLKGNAANSGNATYSAITVTDANLHS